jgi:hypothetical protein
MVVTHLCENSDAHGAAALRGHRIAAWGAASVATAPHFALFTRML